MSDLHTTSWLIGGQLRQALCKLVPFFGDVSFAVSIQNLILQAANRFGAVVFPLRSPLIRSKLCPFFILVTWIFAIVFNSPEVFTLELVEDPEGTWYIKRWKKVFEESLSFASFLLAHKMLSTYNPLLLLVILHSSSLSTSRHRHTQLNSPSTISNSEKEETEAFKCSLLS